MYLQKPRHDAVTMFARKRQRLDKGQTGVIFLISFFPYGSNSKRIRKIEQSQVREVGKGNGLCKPLAITTEYPGGFRYQWFVL